MYTNHLQLLLFIVFDFKAIYKYNKKTYRYNTKRNQLQLRISINLSDLHLITFNFFLNKVIT